MLGPGYQLLRTCERFPRDWSAQGWSCVVGGELSRRPVVDESLIEQPLDGPSLGSHIPRGLPGQDQRRVVFTGPVPEASERATALQSRLQALAGHVVAVASVKSTMSWYQAQGGRGSI